MDRLMGRTHTVWIVLFWVRIWIQSAWSFYHSQQWADWNGGMDYGTFVYCLNHSLLYVHVCCCLSDYSETINSFANIVFMQTSPYAKWACLCDVSPSIWPLHFSTNLPHPLGRCLCADITSVYCLRLQTESTIDLCTLSARIYTP